jgi:serine/threonine protein kinase
MECDWWSLGVILFECLYGYPPFDSNDQMKVCKNVLAWKTTLVFPKSPRESISENCISFVKSLVCASENRLGAENGACELKSHKWFREGGAIDFERIRDLDAPYLPSFCNELGNIQQKLRDLDSVSVEFQNLVKTFTSRFDELGNEPLPGYLEGKTGGHQPPDPSFIGFTYRPPYQISPREVLTNSKSVKS